MSQQVKRHWKHSAIDKSGLLSDLWDVFIAIGGRAAGWILFGCMVANILQIIPSIHVPEAVTNVIMVVQVLTLDIAGFGLNTIAKHVLKSTQDEDARKTAEGAKKLATCLIGLMMLTVGLITIGWLYAPAKPATDTIDHVLILARVILIVIYMHCMHDLRQVELEIGEQAEQTAQANDQLGLDNQKRIDTLSSENRDLRSLVNQLIGRLDAQEQRHLQAIEESNKEVRNMVMQQLTQVTINLVDDRLNEVVSASTGGHLPLQLDTPAPQSAQFVEARDTDETAAVSTLDTQVSTQIEEVDTLDTDESMQAKIYALLAQEPRLSARAIASRVGCSPTTAGKWKAQFLAELQAVGSR